MLVYQRVHLPWLAATEGSSLLTLTDARGRTALHHAAASGDARIVEMLLEAGAEPDVKERHDEFGREMATEIGSASYIYIYIYIDI